ncbi:hypothetical protein DPEC_G00294350 [Dallia pectoralis]|uniref:Uncharacterized protein n=1 Tax=Dallia pectoralis TaxID=75939 RepID=A0ACC2FIN9_DALPE|nr:hypothetical protein DPEC_G00294350 [Dallia pectoralis]
MSSPRKRMQAQKESARYWALVVGGTGGHHHLAPCEKASCQGDRCVPASHSTACQALTHLYSTLPVRSLLHPRPNTPARSARTVEDQKGLRHGRGNQRREG